MKLSRGIKSALLDGKLAMHWDIQNKEKSHVAGWNGFVLEAVAFFCHPAWWILYHVIVSCKEPIRKSSTECHSGLNCCNVYLFLQISHTPDFLRWFLEKRCSLSLGVYGNFVSHNYYVFLDELLVNLRTVPTIVIAHTFHASPDTRISYRWCLVLQGYFCAV